MAGEEAKRLLNDPEEPNPYEHEQNITPILVFSVMSSVLGAFIFGWNIGGKQMPKFRISNRTISKRSGE